ncbi:MAG: hypothetical protein EOO05_00265, partial [Chitinophagaceae bacterium]
MVKLRGWRHIYPMIVAVALWASNPVAAQSADTSHYNFVYRKWNNETGLPQNTVYDMVRDSAGYLWGATEEGLFRFDGSMFSLVDQTTRKDLLSHTFYDLLPVGRELWASGRNNIVRINNRVEKIWDLGEKVSGGWIKCIEKDDRNRVWIGTSTGRVFYIENDSIHTLSKWTEGTGGSIEAMVYTGNTMVIGTSKGLYRVTGVDATPSPIPQFNGIPVTVVIAGEGRSLWVGTANRGLYRFDHDTLHYTTASGLSQNIINSLFFDSRKRLWIGYQSAGYQLLEKGEFIRPVQPETEHDGIRSILVTGDELVWMGTNSSGLVQMRPGLIRPSANFTGLTGKIMLAVYQDSSGEIWTGTAGRGVTRIVNGKATEYTSANGLSGNLVLSVTGRGKYIYVGTTGGIDRFNRITGRFDKHYTEADGLQNNSILCLLTDSQGRIWIT